MGEGLHLSEPQTIKSVSFFLQILSNYLFYLFNCVTRKSAHRKRKKKTHTHTHAKKKVYNHALLVLERQRRAVSFFQTIHSEQINKASNTFRTTKSAREK